MGLVSLSPYTASYARVVPKADWTSRVLVD